MRQPRQKGKSAQSLNPDLKQPDPALLEATSPGPEASSFGTQAEANLLALIESTEDHFWSVDLNYRLTLFNRAFQSHIERVYGVRPAVGMRIEDLLSPERAALWPPFFERVLSQGTFHIEYPLLDEHVLEFTFNPIVGNSRITGVSVFGKDITERKRTAQALAESEQRFRTFFEENASVMLLLEAETGEIVAANRAAAALYGYPREQLVGMFTSQINTPPPEQLALDRRRALNKERNFFTYRNRLASGEERDVEVYSSPFVVGGKSLLCAIVHDVSERVRAEQALRRSAESLSEAQRIGGLGLYVLDIRSGRWTGTEVLDEIFGIGKDYDHSVTGWTALIHPDDQAMMDAYFAEEVVGKGQTFNKEYRIVRHSDRAVRWLHGMGRLDFDALGQPLTMRGTIQDITGRKRAEMELRDSEERYRSTFEQAAIGIVHGTLNGRILRCNARFAEMIGYLPEEIPGLAVEQLTAREDVSESSQAMRRVWNGEVATASFEKRYIRKDGSQVWARATISIQRDGDGRALHLIAVIEDTHARKAAEERLAITSEALRQSEERYRLTFEQAPVGIVHTSFDGTFLRCNARFAEIVGYPAGQVPGLSLQQITAPEDMAETVSLLQRFAGGTEGTRSLEKRYVRKDGSRTWARVTISTLRDAEGRAQHSISLVEDIDARKMAEERLNAAQEALRLSEERYRTAFQTSLDSININRMDDGTYVDCNKAFLDAVGYTREEVIGRASLELGIWADPRDRENMIGMLKRTSTFRDMEAQFRKKNGELLWGQMSGSILSIEGVPCILSISRDITAAKLAEQHLAEVEKALRASEARYRTAFQTSHNAVDITRLGDGMYFDINKTFLDVLGYEREEVIGRTAQELNIWADPSDRQLLADRLRSDSAVRGEFQLRKKSGEVFWALMSASVFEHDGVTCVLSVSQDISDAKAAKDEIRNLAFYDPLTGLPNRRLLLDRLHQALASSARNHRKQAILFIDLDNFKTLNDTLGHKVGDLLLLEVAVRIRSCVRDADTVARLGGDEFVVMLEDLSESAEEAAAQAQPVGEKILAALGQPFLIAGRECLSTASIGITIFGDQRQGTDEVLQQADIAMYQAKAAGRNAMHFFAPALQAAVHARAAMEKDLRAGIKDNEFVLYYQPQIDNGRLFGVEALIRWNHPRRGLLAPDEFISLAEETGLILPLGDWVLETACRQIAAWACRNEAAGLSISVNISARQFRQPEFVRQVLSALECTGANPQRLTLELTESMLLDNVEDTIEKMTVLKTHGLQFSLDDFGTGYSSLAYLKRLPLDQLKIDRSFVRDILVDMSSGAIAQAVISLSRAMGLTVIAEGVETEAQRDRLAALGCLSYQGFYFSRPVPIEEFHRIWLGWAETSIPVG